MGSHRGQNRVNVRCRPPARTLSLLLGPSWSLNTKGKASLNMRKARTYWYRIAPVVLAVVAFVIAAGAGNEGG